MLSKEATTLLKAIGAEGKKDPGARNDIESRNLLMERTVFLNAVQELSGKCFLTNGLYDRIIDNNPNPTDRSNVILHNPNLTEAGEQAFQKLKI